MIVTHLKNNLYQIEARQWKNGLKKSKSTTGTLDKNNIYFENGKAIELTEDNEFVVKNYKYIKMIRPLENHLKYKNYKDSIEYSFADGVWFGKILEINDLVSYEAELKENLTLAFVEAVEDYLRKGS
tara:strand:- start:2795 stop:3175 length:381 start_codon:yes stop_codon:yes gene_type:complete